MAQGILKLVPRRECLHTTSTNGGILVSSINQGQNNALNLWRISVRQFLDFSHLILNFHGSLLEFTIYATFVHVRLIWETLLKVNCIWMHVYYYHETCHYKLILCIYHTFLSIQIIQISDTLIITHHSQNHFHITFAHHYYISYIKHTALSILKIRFCYMLWVRSVLIYLQHS